MSNDTSKPSVADPTSIGGVSHAQVAELAHLSDEEQRELFEHFISKFRALEAVVARSCYFVVSTPALPPSGDAEIRLLFELQPGNADYYFIGIRRDALTLGKVECGVELRLAGADRAITYRTTDHQVTRAEQAAGETPKRYVWTLEMARVDMALEPIGASAGLVWTSFTTVAPVDRGPALERRFATAAAVGQGGAP